MSQFIPVLSANGKWLHLRPGVVIAVEKIIYIGVLPEHQKPNQVRVTITTQVGVQEAVLFANAAQEFVGKLCNGLSIKLSDA